MTHSALDYEEIIVSTDKRCVCDRNRFKNPRPPCDAFKPDSEYPWICANGDCQHNEICHQPSETECEMCDGRGIVATVEYAEGIPYPAGEDCPLCNGTGIVETSNYPESRSYEEHPCPECSDSAQGGEVRAEFDYMPESLRAYARKCCPESSGDMLDHIIRLCMETAFAQVAGRASQGEKE